VHYVRNHRDEVIVSNLLLTRDFVSSLPKAIEGAEAARVATDLLLGYFKGMSDKEQDNFRFLDEHEWRIVFSFNAMEKGLIVATGLKNPAYRIALALSDIRLIVFPDATTRQLAIASKVLLPLIGSGSVPMLTIQECESF
jgi:hypothetical protein